MNNEPKTFVFTGWFGFWMFMTVFLLCDTYLYSQGHQSMFWKYNNLTEDKSAELHKSSGSNV